MLAATAFHFIVLVPQLLGEQLSQSAKDTGVVRQAAEEEADSILPVLPPVRMVFQAKYLPIIQPITLSAQRV